MWERCLNFLFQNQCPPFWLPLFVKEYLNPQVRINEMLNQQYQLPSKFVRISLKDTSFHLLGLYLFRLFVKFSFLYPTMVGKFSKIYAVQITRKCIYMSKRWIYMFLLMPSGKTPPQVLIRQMEILHSPHAEFSQKSVSPSRKGQEYIMYPNHSWSNTLMETSTVGMYYIHVLLHLNIPFPKIEAGKRQTTKELFRFFSRQK